MAHDGMQEPPERGLDPDWRRLVEGAPELILELDRDGTVTYVNQPVFGAAVERVTGTSVERWLAPKSTQAFRAALRSVFDHGEPASFESLDPASGRAHSVRIAPLGPRGATERGVLVTHDITELREAEARREESSSWLRALVDGYFDAVALSMDLRLVEVNDKFVRLFGYAREQIAGMTVDQFTTPESLQVVLAHIRSGDEEPYEVTGVRQDGSTFQAEVFGRNVIYRGQPARVTCFRDLSAQKATEAAVQRVREAMLQAQKLEQLGVLAGGIAHDFNNLLQVIQGNLDLALLRLPEIQPAAEVGEFLVAAQAATRRASDLTKQMLTYAGGGTLSAERLDLSEIVRDMSELLRVSISKRAEMKLDLSRDLPAVLADAGQIRQVVMNLITNSSEALVNGEGRIMLRTGRTHIGPELGARCAVNELSGPGEVVFIEVCDTGAGMPPQVVARVFDPFFTTKFTGRGLGLATVMGVVRAHRGAIDVQSTPGAGTKITVFLPADADAPPARRATPIRVERVRYEGRVLVANGEPELRGVLSAVLGSLGLEVVAVAAGRAAVEAFRSDPASYALVLLDLNLPGLDGAAALARIRAERADVPVVMMSGGSDAEPRVPPSDELTRLLAKPFSVRALTETLADLLPAP